MNVLEYAKGVERLVNPMEVGKVHYYQTKLKHLPVWLQKKIVTKAAKKANKMPFVVEPYCTFLFYEINEPEKIQKYLPDNFAPTKAAVFEGDTERYYGIVSMFRIHTSVFWGARTEFYLVAKNVETGLLSWIMMDYLSDTISYDEKSGLKSQDSKNVVMTTTCEGDFICDMKSISGQKSIHCEASLLKTKMRSLDQKLWIEGNTSIAYGRLAGESDGDLFSLTFFPEEMKQALEIPLSSVRTADITGNVSKIKGTLRGAATFPFAQHMLSDAPGASTHYGSEDLLRRAVEKIDFNKINTLNQPKK
ncbi:hypothetical protein IKF94_02115 [Candidatus Saccharibacteria bacterium]|nr:hypothetical protein [Candidatus Saccharibacteria bacterium]